MTQHGDLKWSRIVDNDWTYESDVGASKSVG